MDFTVLPTLPNVNFVIGQLFGDTIKAIYDVYLSPRKFGLVMELMRGDRLITDSKIMFESTGEHTLTLMVSEGLDAFKFIRLVEQYQYDICRFIKKNNEMK